jgi:predicted ATPase
MGSLPGVLTSFVGRRRELRQARRLLSVARLLTLTDTGGVGKTRLALQIAAEVRRVFTDGVWLVELADLRDPQLLPNTVATALGLRVTADPATGLMEFIEDRHLLLVLDNCEHMVEECTVLVTKLLSAGGKVRVLATSRHVLRAEGEHILHIDPMAVRAGPRGRAEQAHQAGDRDRRTGRAGNEQQSHRGPSGHRQTNRGNTRREHSGQTRLHLPLPGGVMADGA